MSKPIPLSKGRSAIVDDKDFEWIEEYVWSLSNNPHKSGGRDKLYASRTESGKKIYMHRFILNVTDPKVIVDHINGDGLDNRRCNLQISNSKGNARTRRGRGGNIFTKMKRSF